MLHAEIEIMGKQESILHPVFMGVLKDLKLMILGHLEAPVRVGYKNTKMRNKNWMLGNIRKRDLHKSHDVIFTALYNNEYEQNAVTTNFREPEELPIVYDVNTELTIRPIKIPIKGVVELNLFFKSKGELEAVIAKLRRRMLRGWLEVNHTVQYTMQLPDTVSELLYLHHEYKKHALESTETFEEFFSPLIDIRFTYMSDQHIGDRKNIGFKEQLAGVLGRFSPDLLNKKMSYDSSTGLWSIDIGYEYHFTVPDILLLSYQPVVYNVLLPGKYRTNVTLNNDLIGLMNINQAGLMYDTYLMRDYIASLTSVNYSYIHIPESDDHVEFKNIRCYRPLFSMLALINSNDLRSLVNLNDLGDFTLTPVIRDFLMAGEHEFITKELQSIFNLTLFDNYGNIIPVDITVDSDLNVFATEDLDISKTYRLLFSSYLSKCRLTDEALIRARNFPNLEELLTALLFNGEPLIENNGFSIDLPDYGDYSANGIYSTIITHMLERNGDGISER